MTTLNDKMMRRFPRSFYPGHNATRPCVPPLSNRTDWLDKDWCTNRQYCIPSQLNCYTMTTVYQSERRRVDGAAISII